MVKGPDGEVVVVFVTLSKRGEDSRPAIETAEIS